MKTVIIRVSESFIRILHAHAQMHRDDDELDAAEVLARVFSQAGMGINSMVIDLSIPHMWRDDIEAVESTETCDS